MKICSICEKKLLVSKKLGKSALCKKCFFRLEGPVWIDKPYKDEKDVEKQKEQTLAKAQSLNCNSALIQEIETFFRKQVDAMKTCEVCGAVVSQIKTVGTTDLCKGCYAKINCEEWKRDDYEEEEEIEADRKRVLEIARANDFPVKIEIDINEHFNKKVEDWRHIGTAYGFSGQRLEVYKSHSVLVTENFFDKDEVMKVYRKTIVLKHSAGSVLNGGAMSIAANVLTKGLLRTGISAAKSFASSAIKENYSVSGGFRVIYGEYIIQYEQCESVEFQSIVTVGDDSLGYMKFNGKNGESIMFFFEHREGDCKNLCNQINGLIGKAHLNSSIAQPMINRPTTVQPIIEERRKDTVADELLKFKNLLDMGAITQEEYERKKKELLG